jgi:hypothetical protein
VILQISTTFRMEGRIISFIYSIKGGVSNVREMVIHAAELLVTDPKSKLLLKS